MTSTLVAIIDDDEALCSSIVDLMRSIGYRAEPFASAEAFLSSPTPSSSDCIIADINMLGMDGLTLTRKLREQSILTPVILITALSEKHLDDEAISVGAQCLFRKPFDANALLECVKRSLSK
ncbi:FixJ family two-component response regulator [Bradyrhizobium sp. AZCC 1577]|uniref:response regulator transcription factor n=1 Tax=Bradyrhizobium sp. AZCC 1577 TaxID=3117019 RepID=UPI002FF28E0A